MKVLNDIVGYNLKVFQDDNYFKFSNDSLILANFVNIKLKTKKILDIGTGNGIIALILSTRTSSHIDAVEIQKDLYNLAKESVKYNNLDKQISIYNNNILEFLEAKKYNSYDLVVCNPPYFKFSLLSKTNDDEHKIIARHEVKITLEEIVKSAFLLLKEKGSFACVIRMERLLEVLDLYRKYKIEPKYIRLVYDNLNLKPSIVYIEGIKNGKEGLIIEKPFIMYDLEGNITEEYSKLLRGDYDATN